MQSGLRIIRIQCNYSPAELAGKIGVTEKVILDWEENPKEIPEDMLSKLTRILGLDRKYFETMTDEMICELSQRPKFLLDEAGEHYTYSADAAIRDSKGNITAYYENIREITLQEELSNKKQQQKELVDEIEKSFYGPQELSIRDQMLFINRGMELYTRFLEIIKGMYSKESENKMIYYHFLIEVLGGMQKAVGKEMQSEKPPQKSSVRLVDIRETESDLQNF